jgi:very-short-patch-repair endonuclease
LPRLVQPVLCIAREDGLGLRALLGISARLPFMPLAAVLSHAHFELAARALGGRAEALLREGVIEYTELTSPPAGESSRAESSRSVRAGVPVSERGRDELEHGQPRGPAAACDPGRARSRAELQLYELLEADPATRGQFVLNRRMPFKFGPCAAEIDLVCLSHRIAVEVDGFHHFQDQEAYRRDRRKDVLLQTRDFWVSRHLADDVFESGGEVVRKIKKLIELRQVAANQKRVP